ncbi:MAG: hypothetical protein HUU08_12360 [Candidatus Brocadia sp.]|nr:hypothetical protein [Candidatus Brocadia sp.]
MKLYGKSLKKYFTFMQVVAVLWIVLCHTTLFGGVVPGTYKVKISADTIEIGQDTWVFSEDGKFESEGLKIESEWENTDSDSFEIKADEGEITSAIQMNLLLIGLNSSDYALTVKTVDISGTSLGDTIKGEIKINSKIKITNPIQITFKTNGTAAFKGKRIP